MPYASVPSSGVQIGDWAVSGSAGGVVGGREPRGSMVWREVAMSEPS